MQTALQLLVTTRSLPFLSTFRSLVRAASSKLCFSLRLTFSILWLLFVFPLRYGVTSNIFRRHGISGFPFSPTVYVPLQRNLG
ncbi:hypothetical protein F4806DRAFT_419062 [Annulohypoxylon nitens]|nr:hypothetical protein F4806DRAFT_419062 [Annulohypoxylon nitens]